ncbi:MFS transporter [Mucilaginibacter pedocola]|nr:MFS transporter [Mucilaginibacter pedocola]
MQHTCRIKRTYAAPASKTAGPLALLFNTIVGASCFLLMFQLYLIAPLLPGYVTAFRSPLMEMAIPAFAIPFAISAMGMAFFRALIKQPNRCLSFSLYAMAVGALLLSGAGSAESFLLVRALTGLATGIMLPAAIVAVTRQSNKAMALRSMITLIFFMATGMVFGPCIGGWLNKIIGWPYLYRFIAFVSAGLWFMHLWCSKAHIPTAHKSTAVHEQLPLHIVRQVQYTYAFTFLSGMFHSGVFVWVSVYFHSVYQISEAETANALLVFGLPGLIITILMFVYHWDTKVIRLLYWGLIVTIAGLFIMLLHVPLWMAECLLALMSVGYCFSQPLFIGVLKLPVSGIAAGRLIALGCAALFAGYGIGPLLMGWLLNTGQHIATGSLIVMAIVLAVLSAKVWQPAEIQQRRRLFYARNSTGQVTTSTVA